MKKVVCVLCLTFLSWQAHADLIEFRTKILEVNSDSKYVKVEHLDSASGQMQEIKIDIERSTHFEIYNSLSEVKAGDDVQIKADLNAFTHEWKALSIGPYNENSAQKILQANG